MCIFPSPSIPAPPPAPAAPSRSDPEISGRVEEERRRARFMQGRQATILTGGLGDPSFGSSVQRRTLLGASA